MTRYQFDKEISEHLNQASPGLRKQILEDFEFKMALQQNDLEGALQRVYGFIHGSASNRTQARRMRKRKLKNEAWLKEIDRLMAAGIIK